MALVFLNHFGSMIACYLPAGSGFEPIWYGLGNWRFGSSIFLFFAAYFTYSRFVDGGVSHLAYLRRRSLRLLPFFWALVLAYVPLLIAVHDHTKFSSSFIPALTILAANLFLLAPVLHLPCIITVSWTLTSIFASYLSVPLAAALFRRLRLGRLGRIVAIFLVLALRWVPVNWPSIVVDFLAAAAIAMLLKELQNVDGFVQFVRRIGDFGSLVLLALASACYVTPTWWGWFPDLYLLGRYPLLLAALMIVIMRRFLPGGLLNSLLSGKYARWAAKISYSFYLTHGISLIIARKALWPWLTGPSATAAVLISGPVCAVLSVGLAWMVERIVERPLTEWVSAHLSQQPVPAPELVQAQAAVAGK